MNIIKAKYTDESKQGAFITFDNNSSSIVPNLKKESRFSADLNNWLNDGGEIELHQTELELLQQIEDAKPKTVTMAQSRLALLQSGLLSTINTAIINGTDEAMKIEWEYATEIKRDHVGLIALTESLGMTSAQLDDLFLLASEM